MRARRLMSLSGIFLFAGIAAIAFFVVRGATAGHWSTASREPMGLAPDPALTPEPVVQVYAARTWGARGAFAVHTWIAVKPQNARAWAVYEVIGWKLRWTDSALSVSARAPDARWYGNAPELLAELRGEEAGALIERIDRAARAYPYATEYTMWPGPNSNTFTAHVLRAVPELKAELPPTAIGKDYLGDRVLATAPSGSGFQVSLFGILALTASKVEGLELSVLGLTFGIDPFDPALKLPLVGRIGPTDR